ncbi:uncharacterized protein LOC124149772 [Haliotis rufescens]|uniref:uncharacterized protein LOC124149772 n=1 Tax=Haliotis rufescens TaxID=6454 RepID=UPI00201F7C9C|nr:uncharacterized protein LOC124149772 [Haliotis rufescens]
MPTLFDDAVMSLKNGEAWTDESRSVVEAMPTFHAKKDTLHRARRYHHFLHTEETSSSQTSFRPSKILGFSTTSNLRFLCAGDTIYGDGTFYVTPRLFYQLYTLQPFVANKMVPLVFLLLPDKKKETYDRAFRLVKDAAENRGLQLLPQTIQMDFEAAAKIAALDVFPNATWKGWFFSITPIKLFVNKSIFHPYYA